MADVGLEARSPAQEGEKVEITTEEEEEDTERQNNEREDASTPSVAVPVQEEEMLGQQRLNAAEYSHENLFRQRRIRSENFVVRRLVGNFFDLWKAYAGYQHLPGAHEPFPRTENIIKSAMLKDERVIRATQKYAIEKKISEEAAKRRVLDMIDNMIASFSSRITRSFEYVMTKILKRLFVSIHVDDQGLRMVKELEEKGVPVVLIPTHKSHIDYIVMSIICFHYNLPLPYIAAGDNLNIPIVGYLFRRAGAFFIRREFAGDPLYSLLFRCYVEQILNESSVLEFFIEGGRSRSGKVLRPKMGMLSVITNTVLEGQVDDAMIVPVAISYDKVIEGEAYKKELLGGQKEPETVAGVIRAARLLKFKFGRVDVNISDAISVKQFIANQYVRHQLRAENGPDDPAVRRLVSALAYRVLYECNKVTVARPTALVATALLTHTGRGLPITQLRNKVLQLRQMIVERGGFVASLKEDKISALRITENALNVLGSLVEKHKQGTHESVYQPKQRLELTFYKNSIIHWFVLEGIVSTALYASIKPHIRVAQPEDISKFKVNKRDLLNDVRFVSQLLKLEFIYKPSPDIEVNFEQTLNQMQERGILKQEQVARTALPEEEREDEELSTMVSIQASEDAQEMFLFLCSLFWPFIDSYWLVINAFKSLLPSIIMEKNNFLERVRVFSMAQYYSGELSFMEALSTEGLSNALEFFHEQRVIRLDRVSHSKVVTIKLRHQYHQGQGEKLEELIYNIGRFRRATFRGLAFTFKTKKEKKRINFPKSSAKL
jgi:glycerol-3-phosphate O-acyltransferase